jgi:hypothetical protein
MPWRVISYGEEVWSVQPVAELRPNEHAWQLMLSFRVSSGRMRERCFWTPYPIEATSKSALFLQADLIPDAALSKLLAARA